VQSGSKEIMLKLARIQAPMFIKEGDLVRINTELGTYVKRVEKSNTGRL
jgi:hypothetical protein